jgi:hypothetical protein
VSIYYRCDPLSLLRFNEADEESQWQVIVRVPSNEPNKFLPGVRKAALDALCQRVGGAAVHEAKSVMEGPPSRCMPITMMDCIRLGGFGEEDGFWNGLNYWFTDLQS